MNDDDNDYIIDEELSFISFIIFQKARDRKKVFNVDRTCLHLKNINDKL